MTDETTTRAPIPSSTDEPKQAAQSFFEKLESRVNEIDSYLCVGLDPHPSELGLGDDASLSEEERGDAAFTFCKTIIDSTAPYAAAYKPNAAFFESIGPKHGSSILQRVLSYIPSTIPILLDVKRGDIGSTALAYAHACYDIHADGVTLSPLMGYDSVEPFITGKYSQKGAFLLCKTSNPGSKDLQSLELKDGQFLFERIAALATEWSRRAAETDTDTPRLGLVVGATDPIALTKVRAAAGDSIWILAPGVGAQGGDLAAACDAGFNSLGHKMLIPVSRGISRATDMTAKALELRDGINDARKLVLERRKQLQPVGEQPDLEKYQEDFISFSLKMGVLKFGSFVLKSGRTSPYFFNAGLFSTGASLRLLGKCYASSIMASKELVDAETGKPKFDVLFGPAYKGIPLGAVVCYALNEEFGIDIEFAYNRKEAKDHGEGGVLVGASMGQKRVLVLDDVITAGTAIRESHTLLKSIDAIPIGVSIALDRAEKRSLEDPLSAVQAVSRDLNIPVISIVSLPLLQIYLSSSKAYGDDVLKCVSEYRAQYGVSS